MAAITGLPNFVGDASLSLSKLNQAWTALVRQVGGTVVPPTWQANTVYAVGDMVVPPAANGHHYRCIKAGTSNPTEPGWQTSSNLTFGNGPQLKWQEDGGPEAVYPGNLDSANLAANPRWTRAQTVESRSVIAVPFFVPNQGTVAQQRVATVAPLGFQAFATTYVQQTGASVTGGQMVLRKNGVKAGHFRLPGYYVPTSRTRRRDSTSTRQPAPIYLAKLATINGYAENHGFDDPTEGDDVLEMDFSEVESGGTPADLFAHVWGLVRHTA